MKGASAVTLGTLNIQVDYCPLYRRQPFRFHVNFCSFEFIFAASLLIPGSAFQIIANLGLCILCLKTRPMCL